MQGPVMIFGVETAFPRSLHQLHVTRRSLLCSVVPVRTVVCPLGSSVGRERCGGRCVRRSSGVSDEREMWRGAPHGRCVPPVGLLECL